MSIRTTSMILLAAVALAGCHGGRRALPMVQESADRAMARAEYDLAAREYAEVVTRRPGYWEDRFKYAKALLAANRPAAAREQMEILYTSKPNRFDILNTLARAQLASGDVDAMTRVLRDEAFARGKARDWLRYGWFMALAGDADEGERAIKRAAQIDRGMGAGPQIALAELYKAAGDSRRAVERYRMALYCEPKNQDIRDALVALGEDPDPRRAIPPAERVFPTPSATPASTTR